MWAKRQEELNASDCFLGILGRFMVALVITVIVTIGLAVEVGWYLAVLGGLAAGAVFFMLTVSQFLEGPKYSENIESL